MISGVIPVEIRSPFLKIDIKLAIKNITDKKYWDWIADDGRSSSGAALDLFLEPGKNISASIRYQF